MCTFVIIIIIIIIICTCVHLFIVMYCELYIYMFIIICCILEYIKYLYLLYVGLYGVCIAKIANKELLLLLLCFVFRSPN